MPGTYIKNENLNFDNLQTADKQKLTNLYIELAKNAKNTPDFTSGSYDPRNKLRGEMTALDKLWAVLKSLQEKDSALFSRVVVGLDDVNFRNPGRFTSMFRLNPNPSNAGEAFRQVFGEPVKKLLAEYNNCLPDGFASLSQEENQLMEDLAAPFLSKQAELNEQQNDQPQNVQPGNPQPQNVPAAAKWQPHALSVFRAAKSFFEAEEHIEGSLAFGSMRAAAQQLAQHEDPLSRNDTLRQHLIQYCRDYIKGKEAERATQSGRERFTMAMTLLSAALPPEEFAREVDKVNRIRADKWFGRGGPALSPDEFKSEKNISALLAVGYEKDIHARCEELQKKLAEACKRSAGKAQVDPEVMDCATLLMAYAEQAEEKGGFNAMPDEDAAKARARELLDHRQGERRKGGFDNGVLAVGQMLMTDATFRANLLSVDPAQAAKNASRAAKDLEPMAAMYDHAVSLRRIAVRNQETGFSHMVKMEIEEHLAAIAAVHLLTQKHNELHPGQALDLHSEEGKKRIEQKTLEVKANSGFKMALMELYEPTMRYPNLRLQTILDEAARGKAATLVGVTTDARVWTYTADGVTHYPKPEDKQFRLDRAAAYDNAMGYTMEIGGQKVDKRSPLGRYHRKLDKVHKSGIQKMDGSHRGVLLADLLAARLLMDRTKGLVSDEMFQRTRDSLTRPLSEKSVQNSPEEKERAFLHEMVQEAVKSKTFLNNAVELLRQGKSMDEIKKGLGSIAHELKTNPDAKKKKSPQQQQL